MCPEAWVILWQASAFAFTYVHEGPLGALAFDRNLELAVSVYRQIVQLSSEDTLALTQLARLYYANGEMAFYWRKEPALHPSRGTWHSIVRRVGDANNGDYVALLTVICGVKD